MKRELKPTMLTREQIEDYQFTKKQIAAYKALEKAVERCEKSGISLFGKQWHLVGLPSKFYMNHMTTLDHWKAIKRIEVPMLSGAKLSDSGADDTDYILDKYIKD